MNKFIFGEEVLMQLLLKLRKIVLCIQVILIDTKKIPENEIPTGESLKLTIDRVLPYWESDISKQIKAGKNVLISAHGNSLRALIKYLLNISDEKILDLNLPTGTPLVFEIDENLNIIQLQNYFNIY